MCTGFAAGDMQLYLLPENENEIPDTENELYAAGPVTRLR
jgi:hypothetical protein